jgi:hypothetical protein
MKYKKPDGCGCFYRMMAPLSKLETARNYRSLSGTVPAGRIAQGDADVFLSELAGELP